MLGGDFACRLPPVESEANGNPLFKGNVPYENGTLDGASIL
jgi:hypothetical protein